MTTYPHSNVPMRSSRPHFSLVSILAVVAAIGSFMVYGAGTGFLLAILAIILGIVGVVFAILPGTRGGIVSVIAILAGAIGIIAAIVRLVAHHA